MPTKKLTPRPLVLGYLEDIASEVFTRYPKEIADLVGSQHGVYALYKGSKLYYVGLATNLRTRLKQHLKDRHQGKWTKFSIYLVRNESHIREIEALLLRIADPKGNTVKGRLRKAENMKPVLKRQLQQAAIQQLSAVLGTGGRRLKQTKKKATQASSKKSAPEPVLAPYVKKRFIIRREYKGKLYKATVRTDGTVQYQGEVFNSPSAAGKAVAGRAINGWFFWTFKSVTGDWVKLRELRKE
jgi:hypothetical protein